MPKGRPVGRSETVGKDRFDPDSARGAQVSASKGTAQHPSYSLSNYSRESAPLSSQRVALDGIATQFGVAIHQKVTSQSETAHRPL
jgi:hypothetical protein